MHHAGATPDNLDVSSKEYLAMEKIKKLLAVQYSRMQMNGHGMMKQMDPDFLPQLVDLVEFRGEPSANLSAKV